MSYVPFLDLRAAYFELRSEIDESIRRVLESGCYIGGDLVESFEYNFAEFCQAKYAVCVGNGFDALTLSLLALELSHGDEVIVPGHTFIATWLAVERCGLVPIPVEPSINSYNIDVAQIEAAITPRTRVIMPVHLYGEPANLTAIRAIADQYHLHVIEDAAQAHGACYGSRRIGSHSELVAWSFYPGKNLGALGDGGAITTNSAVLANKVRLLRNYGSAEKYIHTLKGVNSRLDPIQAAILNVKLQYLDKWNARRQDIATTYLNELSDTPLTLPCTACDVTSSWHLFVVQHPKRDMLQNHMKQCGVQTMIHYPTPPHLQGAFSDMPMRQSLYRTELLANNILSLPIGPHLSSKDVNATISAIKNFFACTKYK